MSYQHSQEILASWQQNAGEWSNAIATNAIASRVLATNKAIVNAVLKHFGGGTLVDIGCGEGWLTRTLSEVGHEIYGVDAIEQLVKNAQTAQPNQSFFTASYMDIASTGLPNPAMAAICNFSLIDKEHTEALLASLAKHLTGNKQLFIQTLHSIVANGTNDYVTGWREGSWSGLPGNFTKPYQWYFRTLENWVNTLRQAGFVIEEILEPLHPETQLPASYIFVCKAL